MEDEEAPTAPLYVWIGLTIIASISFWCQAVVTEERFVPALNVVADYFNIPDDIAGATLMASGASSPELFSSIVSLFITHSALGLGTIVGSEVFNQLIICAGAVYASKTGKLELDGAIVTREVGFYALGIVLLYFALQDHQMADDDEYGPEHIFISFKDSCMVFGGYIAYIFVCANMEAIVAFFDKRGKSLRSTFGGPFYGSVTSTRRDLKVPDIPFVTQRTTLSREPIANKESIEYYVPDGESIADSLRSVTDKERLRSSLVSKSLKISFNKLGGSRLVRMLQHTEKPSEIHCLHDLEINSYDSRTSCFLWERSIFYDKAKFGKHAWHLRWFTITPDLVTSVPDRHDSEKHQLQYPKFKQIEIDERHNLVKIINPNPKKRNYTLMAPSDAIFKQVVESFEVFMEKNLFNQNAQVEQDVLALADDDFRNGDPHVDLIEFPSEGSNLQIILWVVLSPLRFLMHYTLPDVRSLDQEGNATGSIGKAFLAIFACLVWLVIGSYAMVASLENLADLMAIPESVIGVTVSAAGTSLPNYVASKVAAENGFGNQAVSNAFGSNTFNIMVGLGLPWVLYTSFGTGFQPYHGLRDEGITESVVILALVLFVFVVLMAQTGFVIYKWHGNLFMFMYVVYIVYSVGQVYW